MRKKTQQILIKMLFSLFFSGHFAQVKETEIQLPHLDLKDSLHIEASLDTEKSKIYIKQKISFTNYTSKKIDTIYLHAPLRSQASKKTPLVKTQLEDRKIQLYFANHLQRGTITDLEILSHNEPLKQDKSKQEFIAIPLNTALNPNDKLTLDLSYSTHIPSNRFTRYGKQSKTSFYLKNWYITPCIIKDNVWEKWPEKAIDDILTVPYNYKIFFKVDKKQHLYSDLKTTRKDSIYQLEGTSIRDVVLEITPELYKKHLLKNEKKLIIGYKHSPINDSLIEHYTKRQQSFLERYTGENYPNDYFIDAYLYRKQSIIGIDSLVLKKETIIPLNWQIKPFSKEEIFDLNLFSALAYKHINQKVHTHERKNYFFVRGFKEYLLRKYIITYYPALKLLGDLSDSLHLGRLKPLKLFSASTKKFDYKYELIPAFAARQNLDQSVFTQLDSLNNYNKYSVAQVKASSFWLYLNDYLGDSTFIALNKNWLQNKVQVLDRKDFKELMQKAIPNKSLDWFFDALKQKYNVEIFPKQIEQHLDSTSLLLESKRYTGPIFFSFYNKNNLVAQTWKEIKQNKNKLIFYKIPYFTRIVINEKQSLPQQNIRNNYLNAKGLFKNFKKPRFKFLMDTDTPKYHEIYVRPSFNWNHYDKFLMGISLYNFSIIAPLFKYRITPFYSTGTSRLTGRSEFTYTWLPRVSYLEKVQFSGGVSKMSYDKNLSYLSWYTGAYISFKPSNLRSGKRNGFSIGYVHLNKELPKNFDNGLLELYKYGFLSNSYYYSYPNRIYDFSFGVNHHLSKKISRAFTDAHLGIQINESLYFRSRLFISYFFKNQSHTGHYNIGVSHTNDYLFSHKLLGRSEKKGFFFQQYVLDDMGFKSFFPNKPKLNNLFASSGNFYLNYNRYFGVYSDVGWFINKDKKQGLLFDSGLSLSLIPDFLEFYFPVYSSNGFEIAQEEYLKKIRFLIRWDLSSIIQVLRRGVL